LEIVILNKGLILEGLAHSLPTESEAFVDWTGVIYPKNSFPILPSESIIDLDPAEVGDGFRAGVNEWLAFGIAAKLASSHSRSATIVELGASQGLWCISWVKYFERVWPTVPVTALGVEAADAGDQTLKFWKANFASEFLSEVGSDQIVIHSSNWKFHWLRRAVSYKSGSHWFPGVDITKDNGRQVSTNSDSNTELFDEVQAITPSDILQKLRELDTENISLLHLDLQGTELNLLESSDFFSLSSISDVIMLGTHSGEIELLAHLRLRETHTLLISEPCEYVFEPHRSGLIKDGEQIWINNSFLPMARALGLISAAVIDMEEIIAKYGFKVAQSRDLIGSDLIGERYRQGKSAEVVIEPLKRGLVNLLRQIHLLGVARVIWRALLRRKMK
jgi:hypothetical protein